MWLAELAPVDDPAAVPEAVLTAIGARETVLHGAGAEELRAAVADRHDDPVARLVEHCARRRMLLVLDNCEHVVDAAARLAEELLARCPHLTVLATSREPLGVPGEVLRPVEPLPEPYALRLLADRGSAARPGFRVDDDPEACAEICRRLDGLPLGIELAAARLRMLTPRQLADRLDDRFRLLTSGSRTVLPRQQTLRAVVDWSWDLLDAGEREVLGRLSVFAGGCDLAAAEAVCGPSALDALGSLVDKSLVVAAPSGDGEMRYRLLETVAEYARERLDEAGRRRATERAHLTYYRELARTTDPQLRGSGQLAAIQRLEREYENLRTALRHAVAERDEQEALCLALSLGWYWQARDLRIEARNWCQEITALGPDPFTEPVRRAAPVWRRPTAEPPPMTGEVLWEARRGVHLSHLACMDTELDAWQTPQAQRKLRTIAGTYVPGLPQTCRSPGMFWFFAVMLTGGMDRLRAILDATVATCRATPGYDWELAFSLQTRANLLAHRPERSCDAVGDADEALEIYRRLGDGWGIAEALSARGEGHERDGAHLKAAADYQAAMEIAERLGARAQLAVLNARLGGALLEAGEAEQGRARPAGGHRLPGRDRRRGHAHRAALPGGPAQRHRPGRRGPRADPAAARGLRHRPLRSLRRLHPGPGGLAGRRRGTVRGGPATDPAGPGAGRGPVDQGHGAAADIGVPDRRRVRPGGRRGPARRPGRGPLSRRRRRAAAVPAPRLHPGAGDTPPGHRGGAGTAGRGEFEAAYAEGGDLGEQEATALI
ncbi:hypothetical protein GCM10020295_60040 [Streptomyces cinereospinus]